jgi:hypothetical protein
MIATIIAIAITILLAVAAIWFGGSIFNDNSGRVNLATYENGASQIASAIDMYFSDNNMYPSGTSAEILETLVTSSYLTTVPRPGDYVVGDYNITRPLTDVEQCYKLNYAANVTKEPECPPCTDDTKGNYPGCTQ